MRASRLLAALLGLGLVVAGAVVPAGAAAPQVAAASRVATPGVLLPSGRLVTPAGSAYDTRRAAGDASYDLGDFPLGLAISPDGGLAVASLNGRGYGTPHTNGTFCDQHSGSHPVECPGVPDRLKGDPRLTAPDEGLDVVDLATGRTVQVVAVPTSNSPTGHSRCGQGYNCFGFGVAFSPDGRHLYASGGGQDAVYDFVVRGSTLTLAHTVAIPSPATQVPAYPIAGSASGYPRGVRVTPDGTTLIVVDEFDSTVEALDVTGGKAPTLTAQALMPGGVPGAVPVAYLYDVVISPDGTLAYVTAEGTGVVYVVHIAALIAAGPLTTALPQPAVPAVAVPYPIVGVSHPTGLALTPDGATLLVAGTDSDNLAIVPLVAGLPTAPTTIPVSVIPRPATTLGSSPDAVATSRDGKTAYVALAGDNAVAVVDLVTKKVRGYIPAGWYPTSVAVGPRDGKLYTLSAKGLGSRYVAGIGGYTPPPGQALPSGAAVPTGVYYDAENMPGLLTRVAVPSASKLAAYTATAAANIRHAAQLDTRPVHSPIPAVVGGPSPITHVVYIVRENRTFDQVFGDLALRRKDVSADPSLQVLAAATPNAHAVAGRYAVSDSYYSDGEASVQGHWWTSSAMANDYIEKSWRQNYSPRGRPADQAIVPVSSTPGCSIFQRLQAFQNTHPTFTFQNFGELVGLVEPNTSVGAPLANLCQGGAQTSANGNSFSDPNYPSQAELVPDDRTRALEFLKKSGLDTAGAEVNNGNSLKNFQYLIMSEDHTTGLGGVQTPRSQVAQNDAGVGMIISALSKSKYWSSTAVFVTEDDSQDGIDHVDGHRNVLLVASPYAKQRSADDCAGGYIGHVHIDQTSVLRTAELMLGVPPISAYDAGATPLYDLFQDKDAASRLTKADLAPFSVAPAPTFIDEKVAELPKSPKKSALQAFSQHLDLTHLDRDEGALEAVLWQSVRDDPLPADLAGGLTGDADDAAGGPVTSMLDPAGRSTASGKALTIGAHAVCGTSRPITVPVKPGQTASAPLPATGAPWRLALIGGGLLLLAAAGRRSLLRR